MEGDSVTFTPRFAGFDVPLISVDPESLQPNNGPLPNLGQITCTATLDDPSFLTQTSPNQPREGTEYHVTFRANKPGRVNLTFTPNIAGLQPIKRTVDIKPYSGPMPVVFVPGTGGSELIFKSGGRFWLGQETLANGAVGRAGTEQMSATEPVRAFSIPLPPNLVSTLPTAKLPVQSSFVSDVYGNFLDWGRQTFGSNFSSSAYDWRNGACDANATAIDSAVTAALRNSRSPRVILVAHSLGGLVARDYIRRYGQGKVAALIAVGTPWLGAPKTSRALQWGYNFDIGMQFPMSHNVKLQDSSATLQVPLYERLSLLDLNAGKQAGKNWPCVFQMLPQEDYFNLYSTATGRSNQSVYWQRSPQQALDLYRQSNASLYENASRWRRALLDGNDMGVNHYLIAGTCDATSPASYQTDMQMALPQQVVGPAGVEDTVMAKAINAAGSAIQSAGLAISPMFDPYVATDSNHTWGDGTSPLLSATAGSYLREGVQNSGGKTAKVFLGNLTDVYTFRLAPSWQHGSMLNDAQIQQKLVDLYNARTGTSLNAPPPPKIANSISIMVTTDTGLTTSTFDQVNAKVLGFTMPLNAPVVDPILCGDRTNVFSDPQNMNQGGRPMWETDLNGASLVLERIAQPFPTGWTLKHVVVKVNDKVVLDQSGTWTLDSSHPTVTFNLSAPH